MKYKDVFEKYAKHGLDGLDNKELDVLKTGFIDKYKGFEMPIYLKRAIKQYIDRENAMYAICDVRGCNPKDAVFKIKKYESFISYKALVKNLEMHGFNVINWLVNKVGRGCSNVLEDGFVNGNGILKPRGFLDYPGCLNALETFDATDDFLNDIENIILKLNICYRENACFVVNHDTYLMMMTIKQDICSPYEERKKTCLGFPVVLIDAMPTGYVAFGDFKAGYRILDSNKVSLLRKETAGNIHLVDFYSVRRVGGGVVDFDAIKILRPRIKKEEKQVKKISLIDKIINLIKRRK